jgi:hypothetical protein
LCERTDLANTAALARPNIMEQELKRTSRLTIRFRLKLVQRFSFAAKFPSVSAPAARRKSFLLCCREIAMPLWER